MKLRREGEGEKREGVGERKRKRKRREKEGEGRGGSRVPLCGVTCHVMPLLKRVINVIIRRERDRERGRGRRMEGRKEM